MNKALKYGLILLGVLVLSWILIQTNSGNLTIHHGFGSNMILPQGRKFKIWGKAKGLVQVTTNYGERKFALANDGKWQIELGPYQPRQNLQITIKAGSSIIVLKNILIGDLWLASGQSNMRRPVYRSSKDSLDKINPQAMTMVRVLNVPQAVAAEPERDISPKAGWIEPNQKNIFHQSALAMSFAQKMVEEQNIPIGIVHSSWDNTHIESWMSKESLEASGVAVKAIPMQIWLVQALEIADTSKDINISCNQNFNKGTDFFVNGFTAPKINNSGFKLPQKYLNKQVQLSARILDGAEQKQSADIIEQMNCQFADGTPLAKNWQKFTKPEENNHAGLFNAMIAPVMGLPYAGVIWFQGESNTARPNEYKKLFTNLITDWRKRLVEPELPFIFAQISAFNNPNDPNWVALRKVQAEVNDEVPVTAMVETLDLNPSYELHPSNKFAIGQRFAEAALKLYNVEDE